MTIDKFAGEHRFLSNFWPCQIEYGGIVFESVETAYVAAKTFDLSLRHEISEMTAGQAKRFGRSIALRDDWHEAKVNVMRLLLNKKFENEELANLLVATDPHELIEGNTWGDVFWGVCNGQGKNMLGQLLMEVREAIIIQRTFYENGNQSG